MRDTDHGADFSALRDQYRRARRQERDRMAAYFKALPDFDTGPRPGGSGIGRYTSGRRLAPPYDLRDWMWVCVRRGETEFLLSLQTFDRDPNSGNLHALTDRIGVYAYTGAYSAADAQEQMKITPLELPLSGADLDTLAELLRALSDCAGDREAYRAVCRKYGLV
ncbi:hypothetical protein [uncultured Pseudoflavonifractor sp.]|uniref:hypothetical protein n=1 Tax=uncultured Pseudoflavonifractor sp. TaxID=1221379 RepID=UPI0025D32DFC|nr:hypothetical protein [uncultured Pseudoflavonifractor sp.]